MTASRILRAKKDNVEDQHHGKETATINESVDIEKPHGEKPKIHKRGVRKAREVVCEYDDLVWSRGRR
jgi:hypothetical protein